MRYTTYEDAAEILRKYPYFTYAAIRAVSLARTEAQAARMRHIAELGAPQPFPCGTPASAPPDDNTPGTADAIDTFLSRYSSDSGAILPPLPYSPGENASQQADAPQPDTAAKAPTATPDTSADASADSTEAPPPEPAEPMPEEPQIQHSDEFLVASLIKKRKYAEALAIIEDLNLNNPEKSIYFADQIRFLKKLVLIQAKS